MLLDELVYWQRQRKFAIKQRNALGNALGAFLRTAHGWSLDMPEAERKKVEKYAAGLIALGKMEMKTGETPEDDGYAEWQAVILASLNAVKPFDNIEKAAIKAMTKAVRKLPVYAWVKEVKGLGDLGLAVILAEAGDLSNYPKKGHLWKRLGLAPLDDRAYSTWRMKGGLSSEDWIEAGYSPRRRAEIHACVADPLFRAQTVAQGPYRGVYDRRRAHTAETHPDWTKAHSHMDALRKMTKLLLRDLWQEWRRCEGLILPADKASMLAPSTAPSQIAA